MPKSIYLIGSLRNNKAVNRLAVALRKEGYDVFDDYSSSGPNADDHWKEYSQGRGQTYEEALNSYAAEHAFAFDKHHLDRCDIGILAHPAGKSCHLELGYLLGQGKPGIIYWPKGAPPKDRWDLMTKFARRAYSFDGLLAELRNIEHQEAYVANKLSRIADDIRKEQGF